MLAPLADSGCCGHSALRHLVNRAPPPPPSWGSYTCHTYACAQPICICCWAGVPSMPPGTAVPDPHAHCTTCGRWSVLVCGAQQWSWQPRRHLRAPGFAANVWWLKSAFPTEGHAACGQSLCLSTSCCGPCQGRGQGPVWALSRSRHHWARVEIRCVSRHTPLRHGHCSRGPALFSVLASGVFWLRCCF